jgi:peroxiredoxin Q/BCP
MLEIGDSAPPFELQNQDGDTVSLSDVDARTVVLYFYPRAGTDGCTREAQGFRDAIDAFAGHDVAVLGVSDDAVDDLADFHDDLDLPFDLLADPEGEVSTLYGVYGEKQMFGNTFDGVFRTTFVLDEDRTLQRVYDDVDVDSHAETVLADLEATATAD